MDWVFTVFAVGTTAYIITILKEYSEQVLILDNELQHVRLQKGIAEEKIQTSNKEKEIILAQVEETKQAIQALEIGTTERLKTIQHYETEMAKRGKYRL